ncbi:unnamed protein product, partial [Lampetra planeri]
SLSRSIHRGNDQDFPRLWLSSHDGRRWWVCSGRYRPGQSAVWQFLLRRSSAQKKAWRSARDGQRELPRLNLWDDTGVSADVRIRSCQPRRTPAQQLKAGTRPHELCHGSLPTFHESA